MQRRSFFRTAAATIAGAGLAGHATSAEAARFHQDGPEWFTNVEVTGHDGRTYRFYDDLLKDKIVLINFFYTDCDNVCPLATENLGYVQELLGGRVGKDIFIYSLTLQPKLDTPEKLAVYARSHGVGPGWLFLTGQPDDIELLRHRLG